MKLKIQTLIALLSSLTLALAPLAQASPLDNSENNHSPGQATELVGSIWSINHLGLLLSFGGAPDETVKNLTNDLLKRSGGNQLLPKTEMRGNKLFVDGQATSIEVISYQPLNISYFGKTWAYEKENSFEKNYFSFAKFLEKNSPKKTSAFLQLLLPKAHAAQDISLKKVEQEEGAAGAVAGGLIVATLAAFVCISSPIWGPAVAVGAAIGAAVGALVGIHDAKTFEQHQKELSDRIINYDTQFYCSDRFDSIDVDSASIRLFRNDSDPVRIFKKGKRVPNDQIPAAHKKMLLTLLNHCKNDSDAQKLKTRWDQSRKTITQKTKSNGVPTKGSKATS